MTVAKLAILVFVIKLLANPQEQEISKTLDAYQTKVAAETESYNKALEALKKEAVQELVSIAKKAVAMGDAKDAAKAWKQVLQLDYANENARDFFEVFGKLEDTLKEIDASRGVTNRTRWVLSPTKQMQKPFVKFERKPNGTWLEHSPESPTTYEFSQTKVTDHYIELFDASRGVYVRIQGDLYYVRTPHHPSNMWDCNDLSGSWQK